MFYMIFSMTELVSTWWKKNDNNGFDDSFFFPMTSTSDAFDYGKVKIYSQDYWPPVCGSIQNGNLWVGFSLAPVAGKKKGIRSTDVDVCAFFKYLKAGIWFQACAHFNWRASFGLPKRDKIVAEMCLAESPASSIWSCGDPWSMYLSGSTIALNCKKKL